MGHKSGELGYISYAEMHEQIFAIIRYFKPRIIFIPDPYVHYDENRDHLYVINMAGEAWG
jgi:LmbE family N-acetylglucosaminyl deacetylase